MPIAIALNDLSPHAFVEEKDRNEIRHCFLEVMADLPEERLRQRIKKYIRFYQENTWEAETGKQFPTVLIICPNDKVSKYIRSYTKAKLRSLDEPELIVHLSTADKVRESGVAGDIWEKI